MAREISFPLDDGTITFGLNDDNEMRVTVSGHNPSTTLISQDEARELFLWLANELTNG